MPNHSTSLRRRELLELSDNGALVLRQQRQSFYIFQKMFAHDLPLSLLHAFTIDIRYSQFRQSPFETANNSCASRLETAPLRKQKNKKLTPIKQ